MILKFKNYNRRMRAPFVIYVDFECFTDKISTCSLDENKSLRININSINFLNSLTSSTVLTTNSLNLN